jgi:hypothetical protein
MRDRIIRLIVLAAAALVVAACASTSLRSAWFDTSFTSGPFRKIVVVGLHANLADTRVFEDMFAEKLKAVGVDAVPGYRVLPPDANPFDPAWAAAMEATRADGLLAVRLLQVDTRTQINTTMMQGPMVWGPGPWWGPRPVPVTQVTQYDVASVETNLWDIRTRRVVWAASTDTFNPTSVQRETPGFAGVIIAQLVARGLVPGAPK